MKLVIDIPDEDYKLYAYDEWNLPLGLVDALQNGKPLPKGHGRLIDADVLDRDLENVKVNLGDDLSEAFDDGLTWASEVLNNAQPIIEADKAESEDKG